MIAIIGCGNANRSDDGAGPRVLQALAGRGLASDPGVRLLDAGTDGMAVMFAARGSRRLVIVDACRSGGEPGAVFEVPGAELEQRHEPRLNLHDFRWDHALFAGRRVFGDEFPADVTVFLIEAESVELGLELSPAVARAAEKVADRIEELVGSRRRNASVNVRRGSLHLSRELWDRHLTGRATVVLQRRDEDLAILPVHDAAAGGYLLKQCNARGDRVVTAADFFRLHGFGEEAECEAAVAWDERSAALIAKGVFAGGGA